MAADPALHWDTRASSQSSASVVAPLLIELVKPSSVLDVGCGSGSWLEAFGGVDRVGLDELPTSSAPGYQRVDLSGPFDVGRFDLALCLEVGEHLPESSAPGLVESLVRAAPVVVFSAAIPGQRGFGHVNCQWPDYWRAQFEVHGYRQYDPVRRRVWNDSRVAWWYAQNLFVYSATTSFDATGLPERVVHPGLLATVDALPPGTTVELLRALPSIAKQNLTYLLKRYGARGMARRILRTAPRSVT